MKKALIIIGAVFAGLVLLAIVGSMLPSDEPQEVIIVEKTSTPAPTEEQTSSLSPKEQAVYEFIARNYPKAQKLFANTRAVTDKEFTNDGYSDIKTIVADATAFRKIAQPWADMDYQYGAVEELEEDFETYMVAVRTYYKNWLNGISGGNAERCATNAVKAEYKAEKLAPRIEGHLDQLGEGSY